MITNPPRVRFPIRRLLTNLIRAVEFSRIWFVYQIYGISGVAHTIRYLRDPLPALKRYGASIGNNTRIYTGVIIHAAQNDFSNLQVGSQVRIVRDCILDLTDRIRIADDAILSFRCNLLTHLNIFNSPLRELGYTPAQAPIEIQRGAVLFSNVTVLMGVTIGECAIVASGAVVIADVPPWTLVGGVPAKVIKHLQPVTGS